jgi:hypothetical protein
VTETTTATDLEILSDLTNETLEWEFTDEELRRFLIPTNLTKSDGTRAEPVWLLHATSCSLKGLNQPSARDHNSDDDDRNIDVDDAKIIYIRRRQSYERPWWRVAYGGPCLDMTSQNLLIRKFQSGARLPTSSGLASGLLAITTKSVSGQNSERMWLIYFTLVRAMCFCERS